MKKVALITGVSGQDGYYLSELLLSKKYHVIGLTRNKLLTSDNIQYVYGDLLDSESIYSIIQQTLPDEIYNLASFSHPHKSWNHSIATAEINGLGAHRLFEAAFAINPNVKIFQASTSQMYGYNNHATLTENTAFYPTNPYSIAKLYAHHIAQAYRKYHNKFISCGILFNHESPRRGMHFITQKITYAAACLKNGFYFSKLTNEQNEPIVNHGKLSLGDLDAVRDWGHAKDFVKAMWLTLQHEHPDDFIIATGMNHSIRDVCEYAFSYVSLDWKKFIEIDQRFMRSKETSATADINKIKKSLGWQPEIHFKELIATMVEYHLENLREETNV